MVKYEHDSGTINKKAPGYLCSSAEFEIATDVADGSTLMVVDEASHKVTGYYIAFNGNWNEM